MSALRNFTQQRQTLFLKNANFAPARSGRALLAFNANSKPKKVSKLLGLLCNGNTLDGGS